MELRQPDNGITKDQMPVQLPPNSVQQAEYQFNTWAAFIPNGIDASALLTPGFWAIDAAKFKPFDEIRARSEDGTWMARYVVLEAGRTWARLQQLEFHALGTQDVALSRAASQQIEDAKRLFEVKHRGPKGWSVVRLQDKQLMHEGETTRAAAEQWLVGHLNTTGQAHAAPVTA